MNEQTPSPAVGSISRSILSEGHFPQSQPPLSNSQSDYTPLITQYWDSQSMSSSMLWRGDRDITAAETGYQIPHLFWPSKNLLFGILYIQLTSDARIWLQVTEGLPYTKPHTGGVVTNSWKWRHLFKAVFFQVPPNVYEWVNDEWTYHMRDSSSNKMSG